MMRHITFLSFKRHYGDEIFINLDYLVGFFPMIREAGIISIVKAPLNFQEIEVVQTVSQIREKLIALQTQAPETGRG
jgi:hypothetical protein